MFAFALYDKREQLLVLARDRFGIKPLYIYDQDDIFLFASEIRAMRPWVTFEPDVASIFSYLFGFGGSTKGHSFYTNIKIVPPGTFITVRQGDRPKHSSFFSIADFWDEGQVEQLRRLKSRQIVDMADELLLKSVKMQLAADVPVGTLCSGGVDSSLLTAMACKFHNNLAIFHANMVGPLSEYQAAMALANHLKLDIKVVDVVDQDFIDKIPEVITHYGYPFVYHPNSVPFLMVSKLIHHNKFKAILSGEGADECYLGYPQLIFNLRAFIRQLSRQSCFQLLRQLTRRLCGQRVMPCTEKTLRELLAQFEISIENDDIRNRIQHLSNRKICEKDLTSMSQLGYHLRTLLHRNDSLGMAASVEARFPFLDSRHVKLAVNMPCRCKIRFSPTVFEYEHYFLRDKWVLRKVADRYLPARLSQRPKRGFPTNTQNRLRIPVEFFDGALIADLLGFTQREIRFLIGNANPWVRIRMMYLEIWTHLCLHNAPRQQIDQKLKDHITVSPLKR